MPCIMLNNLTDKELNDILQWDVKNWKNALSFWQAHFDIKPGMKVLALGEREGGISIFFAKLGCEVVCTDYREYVPEKMRELHESYGLQDKITYKKVDMSAIEYEDNHFDIVVFKSVLGVLADKGLQDRSMSEIHRVLKQSGALLFAENSAGTKLHQYLRKKYVGWAQRWRYISLNEVKEWSKLFANAFIKSYGTLSIFGRSEKQRKILAAVDWSIHPVVPRRCKYIIFGVFIK